MRIQVSGIAIDVCRKNIKNIHLSVMPPDGEVRISAPLNLSDEAIKIFIRTKVAWIKKQQEKFANQARLGKREFVSGESLFVFGKQYYLQVQHGLKNSLELNAKNAVLTVRKESTAEQREAFVNEWLREKLKSQIENKLPKWEKITGQKVFSTSWGPRPRKRGKGVMRCKGKIMRKGVGKGDWSHSPFHYTPPSAVLSANQSFGTAS